MAVTDPVDGEAVIESWNGAFRALSAEPRRQIVVSLLEAPEGRELELPEAANPPFMLLDPEELCVELVHEHLPMLAARSYVEWEREPLRVRRGESFDEVASILRSLMDCADSIPDGMVDGCQRLEEQRRYPSDTSP
ncbi:hypothetical protein G9C85_02455 [Halorubellus sp. JP-L1]|uniref:hypothetical protein n=1 Tax=Halorubellus sp. JP-L1 TaxID=2715753 RepID=UPI00140BCC64|nr:hypothetical protein [Halorubellus sp. JP-L1]NHN40499.1 hypothetical protein [Halorubellus sp. JP-L1]